MTTQEAGQPHLIAAMLFAGEWRDYQARVLAEIDAHLADGRLHVIAAPGSGKTVLGLEAMRRSGRPALILSPTLTIRDQWRERLVPLFLPDLAEHDQRISRDLAQPGEMTIATYQALHAAWQRDGGLAAIAALGPITLVLDECHHLRQEWWKALFDLRAMLPDVRIVALTATPPYDAGFAEWQRYEQLCGPVDAEIGAPELVRNGDLAPHQDHVHFSQAQASLVETLLHRRDAVFALRDALLADPDLPAIILTHPFLAQTQACEEAILDTPEHLAAMLFFLAARQVELPHEALDLLGVNDEEVPEFNHFWLEVLLNCLLHGGLENWQIDDERARRWNRSLSQAGCISNGRASFGESRELARQIAGSPGKLASVADIARAESGWLGDGLRMAVLTDHVREAELPRSPDAPFAPTRLGVVPIFETLRRANIGQPIGVLTGTLLILPEAAQGPALAAAQGAGIAAEDLSFAPLPGAPGHVRLTLSASADGGRVAMVTRLVGDGHVRVLVGTQALLGEGWDAPSLNTLVLASNTASFMLSNQMRGRAIRIDPAAPGKVANIWHLATLDPAALDGQGADYALLQRRFGMFDGIANFGSDAIENGLDRLGIDFHLSAEDRNRRTLAVAGAREEIAAQWRSSLGAGTDRAQLREVADVRHMRGSRSFHVARTLQSMALTALGGGAVSAGLTVRGLSDWGLISIVLGLGTFAYAAPGLLRAARLLLRNGTLERRLEQVGMCILIALSRSGHLSLHESEYTVIVHDGLRGHHAVTIEGGTRADQNRFVAAIVEVLGPVQNPRYIISRRGRAFGLAQVDYHAVPALIGARKEYAEMLLDEWRSRVSEARLVFTRTGEGRRTLLRARVRSLAAGMGHAAERRSAWL